MSQHSFVPEAFAHLVDLAADITGGFVQYANDDYFAEKENLLKPGAPEWIDGKYTDKGKWMDGWESQRRREDPYVDGVHDTCIIRLGLAGKLEGFLVDTTHFKGNAPQSVAIEGIDARQFAPVAELQASGDWFPLVSRCEVKPDFRNVVNVDAGQGEKRVTHVRLRIFPDGGVARLRAYGTVLPAPRTWWGTGSVDLAAVENGGTVSTVSDQFFGPPSNLLLPGRGVNMGDGWETKRRRTPGTDWCVLKLGRRGVLERIEVDTHFFKGNAPQSCMVEFLDAGDEAVSIEKLRGAEGWQVLLPSSPLEQHRRHTLVPARAVVASHVRVHIWPHGGVNRMRLFGRGIDSAQELAALKKLKEMVDPERQNLLLSFNGSKAVAAGMKRALTRVETVAALFAEAQAQWWAGSEADWLEAFAAHPRIGATHAASTATAQSAQWSSGEQAQVSTAGDGVKERLAAQNEAYFAKHGFVFIVCATGKSAAEMLALLEARIGNTRAVEMQNAAREQALITRLRIEKWLLSHL